jgi:hypothetical protein
MEEKEGIKLRIHVKENEIQIKKRNASKIRAVH